jgi:hypothetical protein
MNTGIKLLIYIVLAIVALVILKFLINLSLLIASVIAVLLLVGLFAQQKMR